MSTLKIENLNNKNNEAEMSQVKGGPHFRTWDNYDFSSSYSNITLKRG